MKLVVGLGNPGRKYSDTRHNIGFVVLDELARKHAGPPARTAFNAQLAEIAVAGEKVLLAWPQTFMNASGECVLKLRDFYKLAHSDLLVVCDDINLPLAKLRFRASGSAGGQKGLQDILRRLSSDDVPRLRIGVDAPPAGRDSADYVLARFKKEEQAEMAVAVVEAADAVTQWASQGIAWCMNHYN